MAKEFKLPDLGEGVESGEVARVLVSEGDQIEAEQTILELETDKALVEVPSPAAAKVVSVQVKDGDTVPVGAVLITYEESGTDTGPAKEPAAEEAKPEVEPQGEASGAVAEAVEPAKAAPAPAAPRAPAPPVVTSGPVPAAPATRRFARELGVDLATISGTGAGGRITRDDVKAHVQNSMVGKPASTTMSAAPADLPDFSKYGDVERQKLSKIRRVIATNLQNSWTQIPHVTQFDRADVTELEAFRQRHKDVVQARGGRLTPTVLILKAVINALKAFPQFNASLDAEKHEVIYKKYYHIGMAVDTDRGLLVPVIKDADKKSILQLSVEGGELAEKTRNKKLSPDQMAGGTFTISNLGGIGGTGFSPIVYWPQVAIMGVARARQEVLLVDGQVQGRLLLPLSLSYDHRVIDGADAARFLRRIVEGLEEPFLLALEE